MELTQAVVLAFIQGVTEFLPISSTAHLILVPALTDWPDQGLSFDVALNTATWLAVLVYFRTDIVRLLSGFIRTLRQRGLSGDRDGELAWMLIVATVPVAAAGLLARDLVAGELRSVTAIGISSIFWGLILFAADRGAGKGARFELGALKWPAAVVVGLAQAIAIIPGTSRSGITMTAGLFMGLSRTGAARFSFLLAILVGALAGLSEGAGMLEAGVETPWLAVIVGFIVAFVSAYLTIHWFLKIISRVSMSPFVIYRVLLGVALLLYVYAI
jgi:undecaprenyl-diphosphatase